MKEKIGFSPKYLLIFGIFVVFVFAISSLLGKRFAENGITVFSIVAFFAMALDILISSKIEFFEKGFNIKKPYAVLLGFKTIKNSDIHEFRFEIPLGPYSISTFKCFLNDNMFVNYTHQWSEKSQKIIASQMISSGVRVTLLKGENLFEYTINEKGELEVI